MATPILIDCDPGHDDAIALLLALASPEVRLLGVTTVSGNQTLEKTTANAIRVLDHVGRPDVSVAAGAARPLIRARHVAWAAHAAAALEQRLEHNPGWRVEFDAVGDDLRENLLGRAVEDLRAIAS